MSKTKCGGGLPCDACRLEKRKSRPCEYTEKAASIEAARVESDLKRQRDDQSTTSYDSDLEDNPLPLRPSITSAIVKGPVPSSDPSAAMHKRITLRTIVEEFIYVRPSSRNRVVQNIKCVETEWLKFQEMLAKPPKVVESKKSAHKLPQIEVWKVELRQIQDQLNLGDLKGAWESIPALLRKLKTWETFSPNIEESYTTNPHSEPEGFHRDKSIIYTSLVELDCSLGFFMGDQTLEHDWEGTQFWSRADDSESYAEDVVELFSTIRKILKINTSSEAGIWDFLRYRRDLKRSQVPNPLEKMATCITNKASAEKQALKLTSNLVFAVVHCRTASAGMHYSQAGCVVPVTDDGSSAIVKELKIDHSRGIADECSQVKKHAGNALAAFEKLCEIDKEETAHSWIRLHSALTAAVLYGIHGLRERSENWDAYKQMLLKVEGLFVSLMPFNSECPIYGHALRILRSCEKREAVPNKTASRKRVRTVTAERSCDSSSSDSSDSRSDGFGRRYIPTTGTNNRMQRKSVKTHAAEDPMLQSRTKRQKTIPSEMTTMMGSAISQSGLGDERHQSFVPPQPQTHGHVQNYTEGYNGYQQPYHTNTSLTGVRIDNQQQTTYTNSFQHQHGTRPISIDPTLPPWHPPLIIPQELWGAHGYELGSGSDQNPEQYLYVEPTGHQQQTYIQEPSMISSDQAPPHSNSFNAGFSHSVAPSPQYVDAATVPYYEQRTVPSTAPQSVDPVRRNSIAHMPEAKISEPSLGASYPHIASTPSWSNAEYEEQAAASRASNEHILPQFSISRRGSESFWQSPIHPDYQQPGYSYPHPSTDVHSSAYNYYDPRQQFPQY